jgi:nucleoside-diphosphate-sugar epimerase
LVTGATGFIGTAVVRRLIQDGKNVRVLVRSRPKAEPFARGGAQVIEGEITDETAVRKALDGVNVVYHLAGRLLVSGVPDDDYRTTHVEGTALVVACSRESPTVERFVHCSTTGVLGTTGERPADETTAFSPTNVYEATKAEAEEAVSAAGREGFPVVIVRPGLVYGPGDLHLLGFFQSILRGRFRPIGRRTVWLHPIYIDDMAEALLVCGHHPAAVGECFHIAGQELVSLAGLAAAIAEAGGTSLPRGFIPMFAARTAALIGDCLPPDLRRVAPLTSTRLDFLTHSRVYSVTKASHLLGFVASTPIATGIARTMDWYRGHDYLPALAPALAH